MSTSTNNCYTVQGDQLCISISAVDAGLTTQGFFSRKSSNNSTPSTNTTKVLDTLVARLQSTKNRLSYTPNISQQQRDSVNKTLADLATELYTIHYSGSKTDSEKASYYAYIINVLPDLVQQSLDEANGYNIKLEN